jgi:hypothetical protein
MKAKDLVWVLVMAVVVVASFVAAERRSGGATAAGRGPAAVALEPVPGTDVHRVTLSEQAAGRLGIETAVIGQGTGAGRLAATGAGGAGRAMVPYSAILYDARGDTWLYTSPAAMVFVRDRIRVERIDGDRVHLTDGLPAGTTIVTVGGAELLAAELGH